MALHATNSAQHVEHIELRLNTVSQLFNSLDASPFLERDLDDNAEAYIVDWARELPSDAKIRLILFLPPEEASRAQSQDIPAAIKNYFQLRAHAQQRDLADHFRLGRHYLAIGIPVLTLCLVSSQFAKSILGSGTMGKIAEESLIIVGWVANWRPIETLLYDWWPIARRTRLYRRLAAAEIEVVATS